ncbi:MAG: tyrosine-type recombinase/integrase [Atopobiaceae bacterium]|nr:tyrosine-type recombinase/integrase [Atopobiaceae bacterium]
MDAKYWEAASIVMEHVANEGSGKKVISYHRRGIAQLALHLDLTGRECTRDAVEEWLSVGERMWSRCKHKENRTAACRLLEAMETGSVSPSPYSHPGPTDYSRLAGWSKEVVDSYASIAKDAFSEREGCLARMYASQFMVRSGLEDAAPGGVTAGAVLAFVAGCGGTKCVRAARLSHLRGFLAHMHERGDVPAWLALLASDHFASHADCYGPMEWPVEGDGPAPDECLSMVDGFVGTLESEGYSHTQLKSAARAVRMLCVALGTNGARYAPENAVAWLASVDGLLGTQVPSYRRALTLFARYESGRPGDFSVAAREENPLAALPAWAGGMVSSYLELRRREGCTHGTLGCTRRACARLASYAASAGAKSWADLDGAVVSGWSASDAHKTAEGLACYVAKVRGFLAYLGEEGVVPRDLWLAARSVHAPSRKVVDVLGGDEVALANARRLSANTPMELRDAALVALGLTMGLRSCDVLALEMGSISWADSTISLVQQKTGASLRLPLTLQAGNALVAYLRDGRPSTGSPLVFVKHRAPYDGLTKSACRDAMVRTFGPGITGYHVLRRTFATSMLRGGSGRAEVAEALGHRTELSTEPYLALDSGRMRMCALPMGDLAIGGGHAS